MKTIIAGSRNCTDIKELIKATENCDWEITTVLCGKARGVDTLGEIWAKYLNIPVEYYPAEWNKYGKSAGYRRNSQMANNADALIALWNGKSKGTNNMLNLAREKNLKIYIHSIECDG